MENSQHVPQLFPLATHAALIEGSRKLFFPGTILPTSQILVVTIHWTAGARYIAFGKPGDILQESMKGRHVDMSTAFTPHLLGFRISVSAVLNLRELWFRGVPIAFFPILQTILGRLCDFLHPPFSSLLDSWAWLRNWGRRAFPIFQKGTGPVFAPSACQASCLWQDFLGFPEVLQHLI